MIEFQTKSGIDCVINCADLKDARELRIAIFEELKNNNIELPKDSTINIQDLVKKMNSPEKPTNLLNGLKDIFFALETSDRVYKAIFKCLSRCTYNQERITEATFEDEDARADYYEIAVKCIVENIRPFVKNLFSQL